MLYLVTRKNKVLNDAELNKQNLQDIHRVAIILREILETKELTEEDYKRIDYCDKLTKTALERQLLLNSRKP